MFNNAPLLEFLTTPAEEASAREHNKTDPVLPHSLPSLSALEGDAADQVARQLILQDRLESALDSELRKPNTKDGVTSLESETGQDKSKGEGKEDAKKDSGSGGRRIGANAGKASPRFESFHLLRAIDSKDVMLMMEIRDHAFHLLLESTGNATPLTYAMRLGDKYRDMAVLITGALSRKVNSITDAEIISMSPQMKTTLRLIRINLKLAINFGLENSCSDLISSFFQLVILVEGDKWIHESSHLVALALRSGPAGRPVHTATSIVEKWIGREIKKASQIASVQEYVANAVCDLVSLGLWSVIGDRDVAAAEDSIPPWLFARDDRILRALSDRIEVLKSSGRFASLSPLLVRQIQSTLDVTGQRNIPGSQRCVLLANQLDI